MTPNKVGQLTDSDRQLMIKAKEDLMVAQATLEFVKNHLLTIYNITRSLSIESNGDILELQLEEDQDADEPTKQADSTSSS